MKKQIIIILLLLTFFIPQFVFANNDSAVLLVPIKGDINKATVNFVDDAIKFAENNNMKGIIFEIDTYGGLVVSAEEIKNHIFSTKIPTLSYVNNKAESAGVLIAISSKYLVMNENATIGSAETVPNTEKSLSFWRSILRDTAQSRGRDPNIIEAMADKDLVINGVTEKGKLVNLTSKESLDLGIADKVANSYEDILEVLDLKNENIITFEPTTQMKFASFISNQAVSSLLVMIGMIGFVVEIFSPGFGLGGTVSIISFALFFVGNIAAGNSNWTALAVFILGLILIIVEIIVPGFGVPGISGIAFVIIGIVLAMENIQVAVVTLIAAIVVTMIVMTWMIKRGYKSKFVDSVTLHKSATSSEGYLSVDTSPFSEGDLGIAITDLRPSGFISINNEKTDALAYEGYIEKSSTIEIVKIEGQKIFVRRK